MSNGFTVTWMKAGASLLLKNADEKKFSIICASNINWQKYNSERGNNNCKMTIYFTDKPVKECKSKKQHRVSVSPRQK